MEDYTGKTNEDLLELLEDLNEQNEMFEDDLDDPDYKMMYDKNAEEIIKIKEALNEEESSPVDSEPMEEEVSMPVEAEDSMSMEEIEVYMPEKDEEKLSTDLDQNTLDEIEEDEREFAEETGSTKSEQIERMNEQLDEMLGPKPTESKREVEENLESIKFSDIQIDKSLFFAKGGKTEIGIYEEGGDIKNGDVVMVKEPNYGYNADYYVVDDKAGYDEDGYLLSDTMKRESSVFEKENLEKIYAKGGSIRRTNISPLLRYTNFEDGWIFNLVKLNPKRNQDGLNYKGNYEYGISRQGPGKKQEVWQYATLKEANKKYDELLELGKTYSKIKTQGNINKNYEKGGLAKGYHKMSDGTIMKDSDHYARGGEVTYTDTDNYANRRMGNGGIKIWENYKNINNQKAVGSFSHTYNKRNVGDYYLFLLDDYDRNFYSHIALKPNEMLFRNETESGRISKSLPLIKINIKNGRVYFLSEENDYNSDIDDKNPKFSKASVDVNYLSLDDRIKKYNQGLITPDELSESVDKTYAKGGKITGAGKSGLDKIKKTSKDNPSQMYKVTDDNYSNIGNFYLKNGKFAKKTVSNADYDFAKNKVSLRPKSDVIYKATEIEGKGGYFEKGGVTEKEYQVSFIPAHALYEDDSSDFKEWKYVSASSVKEVKEKMGNALILDIKEVSAYAKGGKVDSWEYKWGGHRAIIHPRPRGKEYGWYVSFNDGYDSSTDLYNDIDIELATPLEAENNMFRNIYDRRGSTPERQISTYEKGGETASPITNYKKNIMGTLSFDLKVKGMRKPQDFIVYPITEKTDKIRIQSDKKFGEIHLPTGNGVLSKSGNTSWHLASDMMNRNINKFELSESEMKELKDKIKATTGKSVGSSFVKSDNSGAELLAEGGKLDMGEVDIYEGVDGDCTVVMHGDVFEMNQHTMPNMSIDMYSGSRSEYPADISHWGKKIDFKDAPIVIKDKVEARTEEFKKGGKLKEANRKWSHRMWFTNSSPDDEYYYENNVIDYLVENPSTFKLTVNRRKLNDHNTLMGVYKDMGIEPGSTYLNPKDIKDYAIKNNRYEWLKIEGDRGSEVRERVIKKYVDRINEYSDYSEGFDAKELLEQIQILESMAFEEKDEEVRDELRNEANKMRTQL